MKRQKLAPLFPARIVSNFLMVLIVFNLSHAYVVDARNAILLEKDTIRGRELFQRGDFEGAVRHWEQVSNQQSQSLAQSMALVQLSRAYEAIVQYEKAEQSLKKALALVSETDARRQVASILGRLGHLYTRTGKAETALQSLDQALNIAQEINDRRLEAVIWHHLGNFWGSKLPRLREHDKRAKEDDKEAELKSYGDEALGAYAESIRLARNSQNHPLLIRALSNAAQTALRAKQIEKARSLLDNAAAEVLNLVDSHDKGYSLISLGLAYRELSSYHLRAIYDINDPELDGMPLLHPQAAKMFHEAVRVAHGQKIHDMRTASLAWGYLGELYAEQRQYAKALELTLRAIASAQLVKSPEYLLYRWLRQSGRLQAEQGKLEEASISYRAAVRVAERVRQQYQRPGDEKKISYPDDPSVLYFEFVDVLLQLAKKEHKQDATVELLREALETVESRKNNELNDYFQDSCVVDPYSDAWVPQEALTSTTGRLSDSKREWVSIDQVCEISNGGCKTATILYPVLLQDRLELIVISSNGWKQFAVDVSADEFRQHVKGLRKWVVLTSRSFAERFRPYAQQLYEWLIRPIEDILDDSQTETLVIVPYGELFTIPIAALHDRIEDKYLIEKYALATTTGLRLPQPKPLPRRIQVLAAGLTKDPGFKDLSSVDEELQSFEKIKKRYKSKILINENFRVSRLKRELQAKPYQVLHIASNVEFSGDVNKSFIRTSDEKNLSVNRLEELISLFQYQSSPLELLTLSAGKTAVGDDRADLGLAGIAARSGARSVLASLGCDRSPSGVSCCHWEFNSLRHTNRFNVFSVRI